ncbi:hypothetical protein ABT174_17760 [Streptomyces sparsogenes]|uniref:hypothetical protein n=1 Tax=Streptomyces sparsogenes TaxID=67365 RepID=UPI00332C700B
MIKEADRESLAAATEVAVACGWRYAVAARWREHAYAGLDAMPSRRRLRSEALGLRPVLLAETAGGRRSGELAAATGCAPVARAQLLHLLWSRQLGVDLAGPLEDRSVVMSAAETGRWPRWQCWTSPSTPGWCRTGRFGRSSAANDTWDQAQLVKPNGTWERVIFRFLANHPQCRPSSRASSAGPTGAAGARRPRT